MEEWRRRLHQEAIQDWNKPGHPFWTLYEPLHALGDIDNMMPPDHELPDHELPPDQELWPADLGGPLEGPFYPPYHHQGNQLDMPEQHNMGTHSS